MSKSLKPIGTQFWDETMKKLKCIHCSHEWEYTGKMKTKVTCPDCGKKTPIPCTGIKVGS